MTAINFISFFTILVISTCFSSPVSSASPSLPSLDHFFPLRKQTRKESTTIIEETRLTTSCPGPFFYENFPGVGLNNQREEWINIPLLAKFLGIKSIVVPNSCPSSYVTAARAKVGKTRKYPYAPPFQNVPTNVLYCGNLSVMMDAPRFFTQLQKLGFCLVASKDHLPLDAKFYPLKIKDWRDNKGEETRQAYKSYEEMRELKTDLEEIWKERKSTVNNNQEKVGNFVLQPIAGKHMCTTIYTRYYDKCDEWCDCPSLVASLKSQPQVRSYVDKAANILRGTKSKSRQFAVLHFRMYRCHFRKEHVQGVVDELLELGLPSGSVLYLLSSIELEEAIMKPLSDTFKLTNRDHLLSQVYSNSQYDYGDPTNAALRSPTTDWPFEAQALVDYELAIESDFFFGFSGTSSFTNFIVTERRMRDPFLRNTFIMTSFAKVCDQAESLKWRGVPVDEVDPALNPKVELVSSSSSSSSKSGIGGDDEDNDGAGVKKNNKKKGLTLRLREKPLPRKCIGDDGDWKTV